MWLNISSVEVFIWNTDRCVQWIWNIISSPHLSQQLVNDDNNLKVNTSNYFIPHIRKQKKGSQFASFFVSDTWFWRKSPFWHQYFLPTYPHTSSVNNNSRWKSFSRLERWGFISLSISLCHHQQNFILPAHVKMPFGEAQLERLPLFHFHNLGFNYITLCTKSQTSIYAHSCIKCTFWLI